MKATFLIAVLCSCITCLGQSQPATPNNSRHETKFHPGIKGGLNFLAFSNANNFASMKAKGGYAVGAFFSPDRKKGLSYRTELLYVTQGMDVQKDGPEPENIKAGYIIIPHLLTYTFATFFQVQAGGNISFLLNAKRINYTPQSVADNYNRLKYGLSGGLEIHPFKGIILNGRYNIDLVNSFKSGVQSYPYQIPTTGFGKGSLQLTAGYIF